MVWHNPAFTLRRATASDFEFMRDVKLDGLEPYVRALWGWDRQQQDELFKEQFDPHTCQIVVVEQADAGFVQIVREDDADVLAGIYIIEPMRRRGIGTAVIRQIVRNARTEGRPVRLRVLRPNPARALYERLGFRIVAETETRFLMIYGDAERKPPGAASAAAPAGS